MRSFLLSKIIVPLHLAVIAAFLAWVQPGPENVAAYLPISFLSLGFIVMMLLFPAAKKGEDADDARWRALDNIKSDYVYIFGLLAAAFFILQTLNGPRELIYVRAERAWDYSAPAMRGFPSCLDMLLSVQGLFVVALVFPAVLAIRNSLGKKGRRLAVELLLAVGALLGLYGLYIYAETPSLDSFGVKLPPPPSFATFACRSEAGVYFLMNTCAAFGFLFMSMVNDEEGEDKFHIRFLFAVFLVNMIAALFTLSCLSIAVLCIVLLLVAIYTFIYVFLASPGELSLTTVAAIVIICAVSGFLHFVAYPENRLHDCAEKIFSGEWQTSAEKSEHKVMSNAAWRMFSDNAIGGVGVSCYGIKKGFSKYIERKEWPAVKDPEKPHWRCGNDMAQLLAETGTVGTFLLLAPFLTMAYGAIARMVKVARHGTKYKLGWKSKEVATEADKVGIFDILPPDSLAMFVATGSAVAISFFVPVFSSRLNVLTWAVFFATACMSLPLPKRSH